MPVSAADNISAHDGLTKPVVAAVHAASADSLWRVPLHLRRYFTPLVANALGHFDAAGSPPAAAGANSDRGQARVAEAFKWAAKACRRECRCCILRSKPNCGCAGSTQLERAARHRCAFCAEWVLRGFGSAASLSSAMALASQEQKPDSGAFKVALAGLAAAAEAERQLSSRGIGQFRGCVHRGVASAAAVPRVIHQIWIGSRPCPEEWIGSWRRDYCAAHPSWTHRLWRDADVVELLRQHPSSSSSGGDDGESGGTPLHKIYESLGQPCLRADVARYAILHRHGGVYIDADMVWLGDGSPGRGSLSHYVLCVPAEPQPAPQPQPQPEPWPRTPPAQLVGSARRSRAHALQLVAAKREELAALRGDMRQLTASLRELNVSRDSEYLSLQLMRTRC